MKNYRLIRPDGKFNINVQRKKNNWRTDPYHFLVTLTWPRFFAVTLVSFLFANLIFAFGYFLCGPAGLDGQSSSTSGDFFLQCFFFSVQTWATIGYGKMSPNGLIPNLLVTLEALFGMLGIALSTGLVFARFSRPTARVKFSDVALITPIDGVPSLTFRMANARYNQIADAHVELVLIRWETTQEGERYRNFFPLALEMSHSPAFVLTWTVIHPINEASPLYGKSLEDMMQNEFEVIVSLIGVDEDLAQTIHARRSYTAEDIKWNHQFDDMLTRTPDNKVTVHLDRIHQAHPV